MRAGHFFPISIAILFSIAAPLAGQAQRFQFPSEMWHPGKIVLVEGDTLEGHLKYDLQQDLVQLAMPNDRSPEIYSARKILFFEIFDETIHKYRKFYSLPYTTKANYRAPVLFELLEDGTLTLLAREFLEYRSYNSPYYFGSRLVMDYDFFFLREDGVIEEFIGNKGDLLDRMGRKAPEVEKFIRQNRLKFEDKQDLTRIVDYYNSLSGG